MKVSILSVGGKFGGGVSHTINSVKAMQAVGIDAELVTSHTIGEPDIVFMDSIGMIGEKDTQANERRLEKIMEYWGKVPFVTARHGVSESRIFKHSFEFFKDKIWDLIISTEESEDMFRLIEREHRFRTMAFVERPFEFKAEDFEDKSAYKNTITSSARFACCKHNDLVLDIAKILYPQKRFLMAGYEKGVYWYRAVKEHSNREYVCFIGGYEDFTQPFLAAAFAIDLSYIRKGEFLNRGGKQYTHIEAIACGCIPIVFDIWRHPESFEAIWLPAPTREGNRIIFDIERYAEIIGKSVYDFNMAVKNRKIVEKRCNLRTVGEHYKRLFESIL